MISTQSIKRFSAIGLCALLGACGGGDATLEFTGSTMGTTYTVVAVDPTGKLDDDAVQQAIEQALVAVNARLNNWDPDSEISRFNASGSTEAIAISEDLAVVMQAANDVHAASDGQFDLTLGPLIELWGFGASEANYSAPDPEAIAAALQRVGQAELLTLTASPATLTKRQPDTQINVAALAKGYGADKVAESLRELGIVDYMVEIGGDLVTAGNNPRGKPWQIAIEKPQVGQRVVQEVVAISDLGMATSGDYRNYFEEDGVRYSHILDAETGRPVTHTTASVSVLAESAMLADAWATALLALGQERGSEIAEQQDLAALFIVRETGAGPGVFSTVASSRFDALRHSN